ncbi:MAG: hypothetical protein ACP5OJ_07965 [Methanothermobacter sp.]
MSSKRKKSQKKVSIGIRCQCEDRAVKRPDSMLKKVFCRKCRKIFWTNEDRDLCFDCERSSPSH